MPSKKAGNLTVVRVAARIWRTMTSRIVAFSILAVSTCVPIFAADQPVIPEAMPNDRYDLMIARSPFSVATPEVEPSAPSFAEKLFVMGIAKLGSEDMVTISSRGTTDRPFTLVGTEDAFEGISLVSVEWSDEVGKSRVTLKKGSEVGVIQFNEAVIKTPIAVTPASGKRPPVPRTAPSRQSIPPPNLDRSSSRSREGVDRRVRRIRRPEVR